MKALVFLYSNTCISIYYVLFIIPAYNLNISIFHFVLSKILRLQLVPSKSIVLSIIDLSSILDEPYLKIVPSKWASISISDRFFGGKGNRYLEPAVLALLNYN